MRADVYLADRWLVGWPDTERALRFVAWLQRSTPRPVRVVVVDGDRQIQVYPQED